MSDAAERIWATCGEYWRYPTFKDDKTEYVRADLSDALLREAMEALERTDNASPDGTQDDRQIVMNFMATLDENRATLAKLREHLEEPK